MTHKLLSTADLAQLRRIYGDRSGDVSQLLDHIEALSALAADVIAESGSIGEHSADDPTDGCSLCGALVALRDVLESTRPSTDSRDLA